MRTWIARRGKVSFRADLRGGTGGWRNCIEEINGLVADVVRPASEMSRETGRLDVGMAVVSPRFGAP